MRIESFGVLPGGREAHLYTLETPAGLKAVITDIGASLVSLWAPDREGKLGDVVLGYRTAAEYVANPANFGLVVGRVANRIAASRFEIAGKAYYLQPNEGENHLHGTFGRRLWQARPEGETLCLTLFSPDGEEGYPGNLVCAVRYTLTDEQGLVIDYSALGDRDTPVNLTNHTYFNLAGSGSIEGHELQLLAERFTPIDGSLIPTGELRGVADTPFDFRHMKPIGRDIAREDEQLSLGGGYDHNFVLDAPGLAARLREPLSGRTMEVYTDLPGIQLYTGNMLDGAVRGKDGQPVQQRCGLCLETQYFPNSINQANFASCLLPAGAGYHTVTRYKLGIDG